MISGKRILAVIPARSGSKRLPRKNLLLLAGKPLIVWTIETALASQYIDRVCVSTDAPDIAQVSRDAGAEAPFLRPDYLSSDEASTIEVVLHAIKHYEESGEAFDYIALLQPTSPLRSVHDIDGCIEMCDSRRADSVTSVCQADHPPLWCNTLPEDLSMADFLRPEAKGKRSQDLPAFYRLNGAVYIARIETLQAQRAMIAETNGYAWIMDAKNSVDIDTDLDFLIAEAILKARLRKP